MSERLHILVRNFLELELLSDKIWNMFCSLFSLVIYPNHLPHLVILGSQVSLDSNHSPFIGPKMTPPLLNTSLPQKSKSVNKSDFPKSFLNSQTSSKLSKLLHSL